MKKLLLIGILTLLIPGTADAARLFSSGCELQGDSPADATNNLEWQTSGGEAAPTDIDATIKRSGLSSCFAHGTDVIVEFLHQFSGSDVTDDLFVRFYLRIGDLPDADSDIMTLDAVGGDVEGALMLGSDGVLEWRDDELAADGVSGTPLITDTWYRIEINYDAADEVIVRVDGTEVINSGTHTGDGVGIFTMGLCSAGSGTTCTTSDASADIYFDDIGINDTTGTTQTSWSGAGSIVHLQPDGSAGDNNNALSGNCASVDEVTPDEASTIAVLDANSDKLDCTSESPANAGLDEYDTVTLVQVGTREGAATAASESWNLRIKSASGGTTSDGSTVAHDDTTYRTNGDVAPRNYSLTSYTDPTTASAWTVLGVNSLDQMQVGMNAVDAAPDINLSTLWALVEYVDGSPPGVLTRYALLGEAMNANTNPISATTELFTPPDNSLLVVTVGTDAEGVDVQDGMSISGGGLTWTRRVGPTGYTDSGYYGAHEIFTAPVTSATEMQLTISHTGNCGTDCWISAQVLAYTGYNTGSPIGGTVADALLATNGADTITLDATPASDSEVVATRFAVPTGSTDTLATEGAGWTEVFDIRTSDFGASGYGGLQTQVRGSSVSTSVAWVDTNVGNVTLGFSSGLAVEIKAAAVGGSGTEKMRARLQGGRIKVQGGRFKLQSN